MRIVLDTKEETLQDLKDTVKMLQALIESRGGTVPHQNDMFSSTPIGNQAAVSGLMSMFGDSAPAPSHDMLASLDSQTGDPDRLPENLKIVEY